MRITGVTSHGQVDLYTELHALRTIAARRPTIEQAKGMIVLLTSCGDEQAFTMLREISQHANIKLHDVAAIIVATGSCTTTQHDDEVVRVVLAEVRRTVLGGPFSDTAADTS